MVIEILSMMTVIFQSCKWVGFTGISGGGDDFASKPSRDLKFSSTLLIAAVIQTMVPIFLEKRRDTK